MPNLTADFTAYVKGLAKALENKKKEVDYQMSVWGSDGGREPDREFDHPRAVLEDALDDFNDGAPLDASQLQYGENI